MTTDIKIQKDVIAERQWQPLLNSSEIGVAVKDGVVKLSGTVDSFILSPRRSVSFGIEQFKWKVTK